MIRRLGGLLGLLGLFVAQPAEAFEPARIGRMVESHDFNGVILVSRGDTIVYLRAFGLVSPHGALRHRIDANWRWASITKQVIATIAMQEVERGRLALDAPIARYWPGFPGGNRDSITIRHLLGHRSGLPDPDETRRLPSGLPIFYGAEGADIAAADRYCAGPARAEPGADHAYNNCDFIVLGAILERVTGRSLDDLVRYRLPEVRFMRDGSGTVPGYHFGQPEPPIRFDAYGAAGGLRGTILDLWRFNRDLMTGRLLSGEARTQMWTGDPVSGYHALGQWVLPVRLAGCAEPVRLVERHGAIGGVQGRNFILPDADISVIAFTNRSEGEFGFGQVWRGEGFAHDLLAEAACHWSEE
ncbi:MAG: serine hydrolase domain-containing protein [Parasphingopyxis sp.]|uniref:serine hydrolase domain-containing protein n=1 Tax=Parasphingopyxis sp. TaxID=1920299 RepID=UPI003FA01F62